MDTSTQQANRFDRRYEIRLGGDAAAVLVSLFPRIFDPTFLGFVPQSSSPSAAGSLSRGINRLRYTASHHARVGRIQGDRLLQRRKVNGAFDVTLRFLFLPIGQGTPYFPFLRTTRPMLFRCMVPQTATSPTPSAIFGAVRLVFLLS